MHSRLLLFTFSFSILIGGIIAIIRFRDINKVYYPFLLCIWLAGITEIISFILIENHLHTIINNNIYYLAESLLIIILFRNLGLFKRYKAIFFILIISFPVFWILETLVFRQQSNICIYFVIYYSFIIVFMSISTINELIVNGRRNIFTNSAFLLCIGFIIYFTYQVIIYAFWIYGVRSSNGFLLNISAILIYINLLTNLIYALAVLWMPRKIEYSQPY